MRKRLLALTAGLALVAAPLAVAAPAHAAGVVFLENESGTASADPEFATRMTVSGGGFQSIQGGFGGVYVLFGWVADGDDWKPSNGGTVGDDYRYIPDSEAKDNQGFQRFIAFPGSDTEGAANAVMGADGTWSIDMVIPGSSFESQDREGAISSVDCLAVTCGIITIGAHGVKNANNETFTPVSFEIETAAQAPAAEAPAQAPAPDAAPATPAAPGVARVGYTSASAVPGQALGFTGQGFEAGELIVASLDEGVSAVGPLTAGAAGEIAGVLPLPSDLRVGTHLLTLTGAASGRVAETDITVIGDAAALEAEAAAATPDSPAWPWIVLGVALLVAFVLVVLSIGTSIARGVRRRRGEAAA